MENPEPLSPSDLATSTATTPISMSIERWEKLTADEQAETLRRKGVPPKFDRFTVDDFPHVEFPISLAIYPDPVSLLIYGDTGRGKTALAAAILYWYGISLFSVLVALILLACPVWVIWMSLRLSRQTRREVEAAVERELKSRRKS